MGTGEPRRDAVWRELELVLSSPAFARNERQSRFLRFLVERHLEGRDSELKESVIAVEVFDRQAGYDPKLDGIVRTEAVRLRTRLDKYYTDEGRQDPLVIELPKGGYRPVFSERASAQPGGEPLPLAPALVAMSRTTFIGRQTELGTMTAVWQRVAQGALGVILLRGEAGIGKTRLCTEFARACSEQGSNVLLGRCDEQTLVPYQPFVEALSWYARTCPKPELVADLSAAGGGAELGPLIPDLMRRLPDLPPAPLMNPEGQRFRLLEAVRALLTVVSASHPTLIVLEDLHWADQPTLLLLRHLVRLATPARLCIIATFRETDLNPTHPLWATLADLPREADVTRLSLGGLCQEGVRGILESVAGGSAPAQLVKMMTVSTGGNPFFVGEMSRHLLETGVLTTLGRPSAEAPIARLALPEGVKDVLRHRLSRLTADCNTALRLAAVVGQEFGINVLEALGDLTEDRLLDAIDEAVRARILQEPNQIPGRFEFVHALIRETLYGDLSALRRSRLHRRVGEVLERLAGDRPNPPYADLAHHFVRSASVDTADKAIEYATRAGDRAVEALAHEEATQLYALALQAIDVKHGGAGDDGRRVALHQRRATAFGALGQWALQKAEIEIARRHVRPQEIELRAELALMLADAGFYLLDVHFVERVASEALELAEQTGRDDVTAGAIAWLARCRQALGDLEAAIEMDRVAARRSDGRSRVVLMHGALTLYLAGRSAEASTDSERSVEIARASHDTSQIMYALPHCGLVLGSVGRYAEASRIFNEARAFGRRFGVLPPLARATSMAGGHHLAVFDFDGARALQLEAREIARSVGFAPTIVSAGIDLLLIAARTFDPGSVEDLLQRTSEEAARTPGWHEWLWRLRLCQARAELALAREEHPAAVQFATESLDQSRARKRPKYEALGLITRARALQRLGRTRDAVPDAQRAMTVARNLDDPALLLQAIGVAIAIEGDDALVTEARALCDVISTALPDDPMRLQFQRSEPVRQIGWSPKPDSSNPPGA